MSEIVRYRMSFTGRVQGVGFRYTATNIANKLRLVGFVKNEYDGSVTVEVQGQEEVIDMFLQSINSGRFINVESIEKERIPVEEDDRSFIEQY